MTYADQSELTPWFINGEKPARPGVYNVSCRKKDQTGEWFARWDGRTWYIASRWKDHAEEMTRESTHPEYWNRHGSWRGLAQDPKGGTQ